MPSISINPALTTNASGLFNVQADGLVQGQANMTPETRFKLAGGVLASTETLPAWQGIAISEKISTAGDSVLGSTIARATALANATGILVGNQAHHGVTTPQSTVPLFAGGNSVQFFRFGSGAQIPLQIDPALVSLDGGLVTQNVSLDFTNQKLIAYDGTNKFPVKVLKVLATNCMTVSYDSGTGFATWNNNGACALVEI